MVQQVIDVIEVILAAVAIALAHWCGSRVDAREHERSVARQLLTIQSELSQLQKRARRAGEGR